MKTWPLSSFEKLGTPFYFYDMEMLEEHLLIASNAAKKYGYSIHYAIKANHNSRILNSMKKVGFGVDCVSENELLLALNSNFSASKILLAGVGKTDNEIRLAIKNSIAAIHVESIEELEVINALAGEMNKRVRVALRINPDVNANTHPSITTGLSENKFGISLRKINELLPIARELAYVDIIGLHFHIGSQIEELEVFKSLSLRVNEIWSYFISNGFSFSYLNLGGGLGVDYFSPDENVAPFDAYFKIFKDNLEVGEETEIHFELGRSLIAHCGSLISKVLFVKKGDEKDFLILDAGMTDLMRPALYNSYHQIDNLSAIGEKHIYDIVGPVCESSDTFAQKRAITKSNRNDIVAIRSAGAYGEVMSSNYNLRPSPKAVFSDELSLIDHQLKLVV